MNFPSLDHASVRLIITSGSGYAVQKQDRFITTGIIEGASAGLPADVWVKRFIARGPFDHCLQRMTGGKARRLWKRHHTLLDRGLPVPRPLAYLKPSHGERDAFFLAEVISNAQNVGGLYRDHGFSDPEGMASLLGGAIASWHRDGAVHGDLKWSNLLMTGTAESARIIFVDLDRATAATAPDFGGIVKDLTRFYRYGIEMRAEEWVDTLFFPAYLASAGEVVRKRINLQTIRETAQRDWQRRGERRLR